MNILALRLPLPLLLLLPPLPAAMAVFCGVPLCGVVLRDSSLVLVVGFLLFRIMRSSFSLCHFLVESSLNLKPSGKNRKSDSGTHPAPTPGQVVILVGGVKECSRGWRGQIYILGRFRVGSESEPFIFPRRFRTGGPEPMKRIKKPILRKKIYLPLALKAADWWYSSRSSFALSRSSLSNHLFS